MKTEIFFYEDDSGFTLTRVKRDGVLVKPALTNYKGSSEWVMTVESNTESATLMELAQARAENRRLTYSYFMARTAAIALAVGFLSFIITNLVR